MRIIYQPRTKKSLGYKTIDISVRIGKCKLNVSIFKFPLFIIPTAEKHRINCV